LVSQPERSATSKATDLLDERLLTEIRQLYLTDYRLAWDVYLADLRLVPAPNLDSSIRLVRTLSAPDSPLPKFIKAVADETTLSETGRQAAGIADRATEAVKAAGGTAAQRVPGSSIPQVGGSASDTTTPDRLSASTSTAISRRGAPVGPPPAGAGDTLKPLLNDLLHDPARDPRGRRTRCNVPPQTAHRQPGPRRGRTLARAVAGMLESLVNTSASQAAGSPATTLAHSSMQRSAMSAAPPSRAGIRSPTTRTSMSRSRRFRATVRDGRPFRRLLPEESDATRRHVEKPWTFRPNVDGYAAGGSSSARGIPKCR
jgi:type VI secretion system protein ImpL